MRTDAGAGRLGIVERVPATQGRKDTGGKDGMGAMQVDEIYRLAVEPQHQERAEACHSAAVDSVCVGTGEKEGEAAA